jgi:hypothetical protein
VQTVNKQGILMGYTDEGAFLQEAGRKPGGIETGVHLL